MSLSIESKIYNGCYGASCDSGTFVCTKINANEKESKSKDKEAIFVLDLSASMTRQMSSMVNSLKAFRDAVLGRDALELANMCPVDRDNLFRNTLDVKIIPFSGQVLENMCWFSDSSEKTFEEALSDLKTKCMTNMGDALQRSFELANPSKYSWIIVMTDGESNSGKYRSERSFKKLVLNKPLNAKILSLGFGKQFNPDIMNNIGEFIYVNDCEMIPVVFGNLAGEIMTTWGYNCLINVDGYNVEEINDESMIPPLKNGDISLICGSRFIGTLFNGKKYNLIHSVSCDDKNQALEKYKDKLYITYTLISNNQKVRQRIKIENGSNITPDIKKIFYESKKSKLMYKLYHAMQYNKKHDIADIKREVESWKDENAGEYKEEILYLIDKLNKNASSLNINSSILLSSAVNSRRQQSYVSTSENPESINKYTNNALRSSHYYETFN